MPDRLVREPAPGAADAGLHLVDHQQRAVFGGDRPGRGQVAVRRRHHAGLTQDRLQEDRGDGVVDRRLQRRDVAVGNEFHAGRHRLERRPLGRLAGQRERAHGAAVEGAVGRR